MLKKIIKDLFKIGFIPEYKEKREIILSYKKKYKYEIFIETGTFMGDTIDSLISEFKSLYTIELSEELAHNAEKRFLEQPHVFVIQGSSDKQLPAILNELSDAALFWLDAHYSGEFMHNDQFIKTAKGELNTPILTELQLILDSNFKHIILIDDARLFNGKQDYPTIGGIKKLLQDHKYNWQLKVSKDIIRIIPTE
jgi:hypothetical protein